MFSFIYWEQGIKLLYAISAVSGIIGCVKVYYHFVTDSDKTRKVALKWFGTSFILFVIAFCLSMIYDILK